MAEPTKKQDKRPCKRYLKYTFTREEKEGLSGDLARQISELNHKRLHKKDVVKSLDSDIAVIETAVSKLATQVKDGYEYRDIECEMLFDYETRMKIVTRLDTGDEVGKEPMTADELQRKLALDTPKVQP